ncbi:MAG: hypothetical protein ABSG33_12095 [Candidatus Bathyarchaeia archaeon]|jgi:hypothetical protein
MHKRSKQKLLERKIRGIILRGSHYDRAKGESICKLTRLDVLGQLKEPVEVHLVPDVERGEVLINPQGTGSLQARDSC